MTLGEVISSMRLGECWTQQELADKIDVQVSRVCLYEKDKVVPSLKTIRKLADAFNCSTTIFVDLLNK